MADTAGRTTTQGYGAADVVRQKFTSKERDNETGLDYFNARYYAGTQGRFTSIDPLFFQAMMVIDPQRFNLYAYTRNNPLKFVDPSGEKLSLIGNQDWLRTNVLYEMVGGQATFDQYFQIVGNQVLVRDGVDTSGAGQGVALLLDLVRSTQNYLYFAGTTLEDCEAAADLFKGSRNAKGGLTLQGFLRMTQLAGASFPSGYLVGTTGREGYPQPANLANGDPVFAVIAYNTEAEITQTGVDEASLKFADRQTQESGVGQQIKPVSFFIHESAENLSFAVMNRSFRSTAEGYVVAHGAGQLREKYIRRELHITGGFAGGNTKSKVPE